MPQAERSKKREAELRVKKSSGEYIGHFPRIKYFIV